jgi:hypothetical protein
MNGAPQCKVRTGCSPTEHQALVKHRTPIRTPGGGAISDFIASVKYGMDFVNRYFHFVGKIRKSGFGEKEGIRLLR